MPGGVRERNQKETDIAHVDIMVENSSSGVEIVCSDSKKNLGERTQAALWLLLQAYF